MPDKGRKHGELKGETEQANRLASWLRRLTRGRGMTLRRLEERFGTGRDAWSKYLSGAKLIPADLLEQLVTGLVPEPRMRDKELAHARSLWREAEEASRGRVPRAHPQAPRLTRGDQLYLRLDEARERQLRTERALHKSQQMVLVLLNMVSVLQAEHESLTAEYNRALAESRRDVVAGVHKALDEAEQSLADAGSDLRRARRANRSAEQINVAAQQAVETCRRAVGELAGIPLHPSYAAVRPRITDALDEQDEELTHLSASPEQEAEEPERIVRKAVTDNADNDPPHPHPQQRASSRLFGLLRRRGSSHSHSHRARAYERKAEETALLLEQHRAFVVDATHQLRNPLTALLLRLELLALELPDGNEDVAGVRAEGHRLTTVLGELLDLVLAEHAAVQAERTDLTRLAQDRVTAWLPTAEQREVALRWEGPPQLFAWTDPVTFASALDAVLGNALKFTLAGDEVTVVTAPRPDGAAVHVADTGTGLTDEEMGRVSDRFWRSPRHTDVEGTGLGLSIARSLLQSVRGSLEFTHNSPTGLVVTLSAPQHEQTA
ncbi:ATP-binding protein [Streptomyces sp. NPDC050161]|uniref:ATP-binding protein n=1 Tax=Streptomyces sp. NPDC050161 TaxID=3365604 RepID=UPI0037B65F54